MKRQVIFQLILNACGETIHIDKPSSSIHIQIFCKLYLLNYMLKFVEKYP